MILSISPSNISGVYFVSAFVITVSNPFCCKGQCDFGVTSGLWKTEKEVYFNSVNSFFDISVY